MLYLAEEFTVIFAFAGIAVTQVSNLGNVTVYINH
jgi:hypothetical protein